MNVQHSSRSDEWYTPGNVVALARRVLGSISLDPASCEFANALIGADRYYTKDDDGLSRDWFGAVFCNPPGGKQGNKSKTGPFWHKLMSERGEGRITHAIFLCFSVEALQSTQNSTFPSVGDFTFCVPRRRIAFVPAPGMIATQPSHSNAIVYVPGKKDVSPLFRSVFSELGKVIG